MEECFCIVCGDGLCFFKVWFELGRGFVVLFCFDLFWFGGCGDYGQLQYFGFDLFFF